MPGTLRDEITGDRRPLPAIRLWVFRVIDPGIPTTLGCGTEVGEDERSYRAGFASLTQVSGFKRVIR